MRATVVGGGIGGLAAAVGLVRNGWEVEVLERAPEFAEVGAGLSLWANAVRALDALGLGEQVRELAIRDTGAGIRDDRGRWLTRTDFAELERRYGATVLVRRSDLLDVLLAALPDGVLRPDIEVTAVGRDGSVTHSAGTSTADLVVGADGIHSRVRRALWPAARAPEYAGYTAWRFLTTWPDPAELSGSESLGRGTRFGIVPLRAGAVYCFAAATAPRDARSPDGERAELLRRFGDWHQPIPELLAWVADGSVLRHDVYELPPLDTFRRGRVVLLGDAAHAMSPNLGQGACQALEDAVTLAALGVDAYDTARRARTQSIVRRSHQLGVVAQWSGRVPVALRNTAMRMAPGSTMLRALGPVLSWTPPTPSRTTLS